MVDAANQIRRAKEHNGEIEKGKFEFQQGKGDELQGIIEDKSVDLVVAGTHSLTLNDKETTLR